MIVLVFVFFQKCIMNISWTTYFQRVRRLDCLTVKRSPDLLDLKFLSSLEEIIGKTWNKTELGWEVVDCPLSPLQVADNFNLMSLFSANQTALTQNSRTLIEVNCERGAFNGRQQCENDDCQFTIRSVLGKLLLKMGPGP